MNSFLEPNRASNQPILSKSSFAEQNKSDNLNTLSSVEQQKTAKSGLKHSTFKNTDTLLKQLALPNRQPVELNRQPVELNRQPVLNNEHPVQDLDTLSVHNLDSNTDTPSNNLIISREGLIRSKQQLNFIDYCEKQQHFYTTYLNLSKELNIAYGTLRGIVRKFKNLGIITIRQHSSANFQGLEIKFLDFTANYSKNTSNIQLPFQANEPILNKQTAPMSNSTASYIDKIERKENLSIWNLDIQMIKTCWTLAAEHGLSPGHFAQIKEVFALKQWGIGEDAQAVVVRSLQYLEWQLEQGNFVDKAGKQVDKPIIYWLRSLQRNGDYQKPTNYIDKALEAKKEILAIQKEELRIRQGLIETRQQLEQIAEVEKIEQTLYEMAEQGKEHRLWEKMFTSLSSIIQTIIQSRGSTVITQTPYSIMVKDAIKKILCVEDT